MFELCKLIWDVVVLRDTRRKGQLTLRTMLYGFGVAALLYGTGLPASLLYQAHPRYKPVFVAAIVFDVLLVAASLIWWFRKGRNAQCAHPSKVSTASESPKTISTSTLR